MKDDEFYFPRKAVSLVALDGEAETNILRFIVESVSGVATCHFPGTPNDFAKCLACDERDPQFIIISGHGDPEGFHADHFNPEIDADILQEGLIHPAKLVQTASLPDKIVISTACYTGSKPFVDLFLNAGAKLYIAPKDAPEGSVVPLFLHIFFYLHFIIKMSVADSLAKANQLQDEGELFSLFSGEAEQLINKRLKDQTE